MAIQVLKPKFENQVMMKELKRLEDQNKKV